MCRRKTRRRRWGCALQKQTPRCKRHTRRPDKSLSGIDNCICGKGLREGEDWGSGLKHYNPNLVGVAPFTRKDTFNPTFNILKSWSCSTKPHRLGFLTFQVVWWGEKARNRAAGSLYFAVTLKRSWQMPNRVMNLNYWEFLRCAPLRSAFSYSSALTQPDLRARLQHTPTCCRNTLLSVGRFPKHTPSLLLPKQETHFVKCQKWFAQGKGDYNTKNNAARQCLPKAACVSKCSIT